jgi:hypothetical protein
MNSKYLIADEPRPSALGQHVVNPQWPMLAQMMAGTWLAIPWFIFNSLALGSPNRNKEIALAISSIIGSVVLIFLIDYLASQHIISGIWIPLTSLALVAFRLYIAYLLAISQSSVFELWQYFGGIERNGVALLILGSFIGRSYLTSQISSNFLQAVLF